MLKNYYLVVKIGVSTAENEPFKSGDVLLGDLPRDRALPTVPALQLGSGEGAPAMRMRALLLLCVGALAARSPSPRHITLSGARSRLYRRRFWPPSSHFAAFSKIYKICTLLHCSELNFLEKMSKIFRTLSKIQNFEISTSNL